MAIALKPHVENRLGSWSSPTVQITNALSRICPELITPRNCSLSPRNVSASSAIRVGVYFSIVRYTAAGEILDADNGRFASFPISVNTVDLPHLITGEATFKIGAT